MSPEQLAFLQNFYTDVTLYVPAERDEPAAPPAQAPVPAVAPAVAPVAPVRPTISQSLPGHSRQSAGLERLAAGKPLLVAPPPPAAQGVSGIPANPAAAAPVPAVPPVMLTPFSTLGDNAQGLVLLFRVPADQFIKLHRNVFLNKMLQALNLVMADVVLVNVEAELPVALANLRRYLAATHVIAFGKNLLDTTLRNTQIYEPVLFPSLNLSYLASATVDLVEYDVSLKKRLWPGLQAMLLG